MKGNGFTGTYAACLIKSQKWKPKDLLATTGLRERLSGLIGQYSNQYSIKALSFGLDWLDIRKGGMPNKSDFGALSQSKR